MATATGAGTAEVVGSAGDQCVVLRGIDWEGYEALLRLRGEAPSPRIIYQGGRALLVSPSRRREQLAERLGLFVMEVVVGLRLPCVLGGSMTFRDPAQNVGVEPDKAFYLSNARAAVNSSKDRWEAGFDPVPDLVIEAVHTHGAREALTVYRRLGVPEVWVCDGSALEILVLRDRSEYAAEESSRAFPFLKGPEIFDRLHRAPDATDMEWAADLRDWVRDKLRGRLSGPGGGPA